ncbi:hypothetical protein M0812_00257 [Anaeramoeba flamelloides]|uniref:Uncharacterized protein n=1 Tax=Anaeramoeba flamelloides TaxID=1746091 RepID=A0AAV8A2I3_9EUKA|nr:hypothetical protein M0812_00257 [Anaeramoeba flamelloides]
MNHPNKTFLLLLIFLVFSKNAFAGNCTDYESNNDCVTGDDQCHCVWYQCKAGDVLDKNNAWCLEGDKNGVKESIKKNYPCPLSDDGVSTTYKCSKSENESSSSGKTAIIAVSIIVVVAIVLVAIYLIRKKKRSPKYDSLSTPLVK